MRFVFVCQAVDAADPVHATTVRWIEVLAGKPGVDRITVLALRVGGHRLPSSVEVRRVGGDGRAATVARFLREAVRALHQGTDAYFIHQTGPYSALLSPARLLLRKPIYHWVAHPDVSRLTRFQARWCDTMVFTSSRGAFPLDLPKVRVVGQGVDTEMFRVIDGVKQSELIAVGRIAPVKRVDQMIRAVARARDLYGREYRLDIYGPEDPGSPYALRVRSMMVDLRLEGLVRLRGPVAQTDLPGILNSHRACLNFSSGAIDRSAIEAMACGLPVITTNPLVGAAIPPAVRDLLVAAPDDTDSQAAAIHRVLESSDRERAAVGRVLRELAERDHGVVALFDRILEEMKTP